MAHRVIAAPKKAIQEYNSTCQLHGVVEGDISPCSHFDHCERDAVIWLYDTDGAPFIWGLCNQCYEYSFPTKEYWYRVVRVSSEFKGML